MKNFKNPSDAEVRRGFPGGWKDDKENKFQPAGRNPQEQAAWLHVSTLANFRKSSPALTKGKLMQFVPENGLYTYFRYDPKQTVMVISHTGKEETTVNMGRFTERTAGFTRMRDIHSGEIKSLQNFTIRAGQSHVFELLK
jgi:glycosidase